jgi:hypothetical protein
VLRFFDGEQLEGKVGETAVLIATDHQGWPRAALLSAGEVLASSSSRLVLLTHAGSRTTRALQESGRGMLLLVLAGVVHKVMLEVSEAVTPQPTASFTVLVATVSACEQDRASYATVLHGIEFELTDQQEVLGRWYDQIRLLRTVQDR